VAVASRRSSSIFKEVQHQPSGSMPWGVAEGEVASAEGGGNGLGQGEGELPLPQPDEPLEDRRDALPQHVLPRRALGGLVAG
jgi:hypothetical protein